MGEFIELVLEMIPELMASAFLVMVLLYLRFRRKKK